LYRQQTPQLTELIDRTREQERDSFAGHDDAAGVARFVKRIVLLGFAEKNAKTDRHNRVRVKDCLASWRLSADMAANECRSKVIAGRFYDAASQSPARPRASVESIYRNRRGGGCPNALHKYFAPRFHAIKNPSSDISFPGRSKKSKPVQFLPENGRYRLPIRFPISGVGSSRRYTG